MASNISTYDENLHNVIVDQHSSDEYIAKDAVITRIGSTRFNENFMRNDRKIMIMGMKVGYIYGASSYTSANYDGLIVSRTDMISANNNYGVMYPRDGFIPPGSMSTEEGKALVDGEDGNPQLVNNGNVRLLIPFTFSKDTLYKYTKPADRNNQEVNGGIDDIEQINELGVYAQVFQKATPWYANAEYKDGDLVIHPDVNNVDSLGNPVAKFYRYTGNYPSSSTPTPDGTDPLWARYGYSESPLKGYTDMVEHYWIPVFDPDTGRDSEPFLLYYIAKYEHPLCVDFGHSISYLLAIDFLDGIQLKSFYINQEDTIAFPEIQLAYLATLSTAHRYARDIHRENQVLRGLRGRWQEETIYSVGDIVVSKEWILDTEKWGSIDYIWKCNWGDSQGSKPCIPPSGSSAWQKINVYSNRTKNDLQEIWFNSGLPDHTFTFTFSDN